MSAKNDEQILELAGYAKKIEAHYGCYMDMEWGIDARNNKIWILQARPETVWSRRNKDKKTAQAETKAAATDRKVIVKGLPASPGLVSGRTHVILDPSHIDELRLSLKVCPPARALYPAARTLFLTRPTSTSSRKAKSL